MSETDRHILLAANSLRGRPAPLHFDMSEYVVRAVRTARRGGEARSDGDARGKGIEGETDYADVER
ncbi:hypothetical protein [Cohnella hashimotonis]|uniref:Uncharacterized protein n=1 Tax=Cohnella hashimotonis TaxID=2826895 RepID=A0ABT6TAQ7_9BACL|nr:hypothetical protein [Cohnella hashimotonis]MDI4643923.1 hypothetical protein [Cohnella hashimotonis]